MAPRARHIDDLLEWVPGPSTTVSASAGAAITAGIRGAARAKWLLLLLWTGYFLIAAGGLGVALELLRFPATFSRALVPLLAAAGGSAPTATPLADVAWQALLTGSSVRRLFVATPWFLLLYGVLAGGVINCLRAPRPAPLLAQLGAACGWTAGRFLRLLALTALLAALLAWAFGPPLDPDRPRSVQILLLVVGSMVPAAIVDYARVRTVVRDSRSMVLEVARAARFFARNLPRLLLLELLVFALGAAAGLLALGVAAVAGRLFSAPVAAAIATQSLVVALLWVRLVAWGAMLSIHQGLTLRRLQERAHAESA